MTHRRGGINWPWLRGRTRKHHAHHKAPTVDTYYLKLHDLIENPYNKIDQEKFSNDCHALVDLIQKSPEEASVEVKEKLQNLIRKLLSVPVDVTLNMVGKAI